MGEIGELAVCHSEGRICSSFHVGVGLLIAFQASFGSVEGDFVASIVAVLILFLKNANLCWPLMALQQLT